MSAAKEDVAFAKRLDGAMADYNGMKLINVEFLEIEFEQIWNMGQMFKWDTNFAKSFYNKSYVKNAYGFVLASPSLEDTIYVPRQIVKINTTATKPLIKSVRKKK